MSLVVPAVLPSSRKDLEEKLALFAQFPSVNRIQIDVVDGRFASPATWPYTAPGALQTMMEHNVLLPKLDCIEYEIDLMCLDAENAAKTWLALGATRLTFHAESIPDLRRFLASAHKRFGGGDGFTSGLISFGLALNIASDLALIEPFLGDIEYVQFMGIARIGQQGQPFDRRALEKVRAFRRRHPEMPVQIDGGITLPVARELVALDVTNLVIGSGILKADDPAAAVLAFEALPSPFGV
ncbi:MAG: hypothetical protein WA058_01865 [Minisyncoccia bacterium]